MPDGPGRFKPGREDRDDRLEYLEAVALPALIPHGTDDAVAPVAPSVERMQVHVIVGADYSMQMPADLKATLHPSKIPRQCRGIGVTSM